MEQHNERGESDPVELDGPIFLINFDLKPYLLNFKKNMIKRILATVSSLIMMFYPKTNQPEILPSTISQLSLAAILFQMQAWAEAQRDSFNRPWIHNSSVARQNGYHFTL